jgi:hypothetical protein
MVRMYLLVALLVASAAPAAAEYFIIWSNDTFQIPSAALLPMAAGDMNGDGLTEIVGQFGTATEIRDAMTGSVIKQFASYTLAGGYAMIDLDNDGTPECLGSGLNSQTLVIDWVITANAPTTGGTTDRRPSLEITPNPSSGAAHVTFSLPASGDGQLRVYDVSGRSVRLLADGHFDEGMQMIAWDGRDDRGVTLPAGVYFVELRIGEGALSYRSKIVLD